MSKAAFLAEMEPLPRNDRVHRAVELGRRAAAGDVAAAEIVDALRRSPEAYERALSLATVYATRDGARVLEALADPSRTVRRAAFRLVAIACDDAQARDALGRIGERRALRRVVEHLGQRGRRGVVDDWLAEQADAGPGPVLADLLPLGSREIVLRYLQQIWELAGEVTWDRLARHHPRVFAYVVREEVARAHRVDPRMRQRIAARLRGIAKLAPDLAISLVQLLFEAGEEPRLDAMATLVRACPCETFDLVRARHEAGRPAPPPGAFAGLSFDEVAHRLGPERLAWLVRNAWSTLSDERRARRWFLRLSAGDREAVVRAFRWGGHGAWGAFLFRYTGPGDTALREQAFERWRRAAQDQNGCIAASALSLLPRDLREREAHRHLTRARTGRRRVDDHRTRRRVDLACPLPREPPPRGATPARCPGAARARASLRRRGRLGARPPPQGDPRPLRPPRPRAARAGQKLRHPRERRPPRRPPPAGPPPRPDRGRADDGEVRVGPDALGDRLPRRPRALDRGPAADVRRGPHGAAARTGPGRAHAHLRRPHARAPRVRRPLAHPRRRRGPAPARPRDGGSLPTVARRRAGRSSIGRSRR